MRNFILKRLLSLIPVLIIVSLVIFLVIHLTPGDPAAAILGENATTEDITALRVRMGLNDPLAQQYINWIKNICSGDWGTSVSNGQQVLTVIRNHVKPTLSLAVFSLIISLFISLPLGMLSARKRGSLADQAVSVIALCGISLPSFLVGLFLMMVFSVKLMWFPVSGYKDISAGILVHIQSLTLPAISLGFLHAALMMRITRASMQEVLNSDYIKMARAKGVKEFFLVTRHALRNALISILTVVGQSFIGMLSGAAIVESLFGIPGLGQLMVNSIGRRDYQVIQAVVLLIALINVMVNLIVDLLYGVFDPRIRIS